MSESIESKLKKEQRLPAQNFHEVQVYVDSCLDATEFKKKILTILLLNSNFKTI